MTPKELRELLLRKAHSARGRLNRAIDVLEDDAHDDTDVLGVFDHLVNAMYEADAGDEKTQRWFRFVRALENESADLNLSHEQVGGRVVSDYAFAFPEQALKLDPVKVEAAVVAWRDDDEHFKVAIAALADAWPGGELPTVKTVRTKWSEFTRNLPPAAVPSKARRRK